MATGAYFELTTVKIYCKIESGDTVDDDILNQFGAYENKALDNFLITITPDVPKVLAALTEDIKDAVNFKVVAKYKAVKEDYEGAGYWAKLAIEARENIKMAIVKNVRNRRIAVDRH